MDPTTVVELLTEHPQLVVVVAILARLGRAWQSSLSWPEYRAVHRFKRGVFPLVSRIAGNRILLVSDKGGRDDAEYQATVDASVRDTVASLRGAGASLHLINSLKRRPDTHGDPLTAAHVVWFVDETGEQVEAYLFRNSDGTTDVYVHTETAVDDPLGHLTDAQTDGDAHGVLPELTTRA